jgi:uncharacterized protein YeaO (DUF488 family)
MIKVKNIFDPVEPDDGQRIWIEPHGLTADLRQWCRVDHVLCHLGPAKRVAEWFEDHPDGYEHFRGSYHTTLSSSRYLPLLRQIACAAQRQHFTFLHDSDDPCQNAGVALHEFLSELQMYCPPDAESED